MSKPHSGAADGVIISVNVSETKGVSKQPVPEAELRQDWGLVGDSHAAPGDRQVSLLAEETVDRMKKMLASLAESEDPKTCAKATVEIGPGAFAENLTVRGIDLKRLAIGTRLNVGGDGVRLEVSKIGKKCHSYCEIFKALGQCPMPKEGIFASVVHGGKVRPGNEVRIDESGDSDGE